ncbi:MAG: hypothetical protein JXR63_04075 [Spirochaetales bacterium]|nr:hypothetical protein [Spirochaetales bacterium]
MRIQIDKISNQISESISKIPSVELIALNNADESDIYDPYFVLRFDVYCNQEIPTVEVRRPCYKDAWAFESSLCATRDMFLVDNISVNVEFKICQQIEDELAKEEDENILYRQGETHNLYRLVNSSFIYEKANWGKVILDQISNLSPVFWQMLQISLLSQMEHAYGDLKSASFKNDDLYFNIALSEFLKCYSAMLFAINEKFEPSSRYLSKEIFNLDIKPEHFETEFKYLFSTSENSQHRKVEVAKLLVKSIAPMV